MSCCLQERLLAALVLSASSEAEMSQLGGPALLTAFQHSQSYRGTKATCVYVLTEQHAADTTPVSSSACSPCCPKGPDVAALKDLTVDSMLTARW